MSSSIVKFRHQPPTAFGSNEELDAIIERMEALLPVSLDSWQQGQTAIVKSLNNAYLKAAQLSVFYRLVPGVDVHIIPFGSSFAVDTGVEAWKKAADRYCALHGITYHAIYEELPEATLKSRRGQQYTPNDVGFVCYIWRSDKQPLYQMLSGGDPEKVRGFLTTGYGHWCEKAKFNKKNNSWDADQIPAQRTKQDVARRRALKAALKLEFSLDSLLAAAPNEIGEQLQWLDRDAKRIMADAQPLQRPPVHISPEGFVEEPPQEEIEDGAWAEPDFDNDPGEPEEEPFPEEIPLEEEEESRESDPEVVSEYRTLAESLEGTAATLRDWSRKNEAESDGPSSLLDYRLLVGELNGRIGKHNHTLLLGVLLGKEVHSDNRPGEKFVRFLLHFLRKELPQLDANGKSVKNEKGRVLKNPNPGYRESFDLAIQETWKQINPPTAQSADIPF